jgi:preprotein translocase subunit SecG
MYHFVLLFHILFCLAIIALVLLQQGKGADMGAAFGSGSANSMFGSRGPASFLFKLTALCAVLFFVTSISLTVISKANARAENALLPPPPITSIPTSSQTFVPPPVTSK